MTDTKKTIIDLLGRKSLKAATGEKLGYFLAIKVADELGIHESYEEDLNAALRESIPKSEAIIKRQQCNPKGWRLTGASPSLIQSFLNSVLENSPKKLKKISNFINNYLEGIIKKPSLEQLEIIDRYLRASYEQFKNGGMDDETRRVLNKIAEISTHYKIALENDMLLDYFGFASDGRPMPKIIYYPEQPIIACFGTIKTDYASTQEFQRDLNGKGIYMPNMGGGRSREEYQEDAQRMLKKNRTIEHCLAHIKKRKKDGSSLFSYESYVPESGQDPCELEKRDEKVVNSVARKYKKWVLEKGDFIFSNFGNTTAAEKIIRFDGNMLIKQKGKYPIEVARELCDDVDAAYARVAKPL